jgi:hypothetical protein
MIDCHDSTKNRIAYRLSSGLGGAQGPYPRVLFGGAKTLSATQQLPWPNMIDNQLESKAAW